MLTWLREEAFYEFTSFVGQKDFLDSGKCLVLSESIRVASTVGLCVLNGMSMAAPVLLVMGIAQSVFTLNYVFDLPSKSEHACFLSLLCIVITMVSGIYSGFRLGGCTGAFVASACVCWLLDVMLSIFAASLYTKLVVSYNSSTDNCAPTWSTLLSRLLSVLLGLFCMCKVVMLLV